MRANLCWMILPGEGSVQGQVGSQEGTLRWVFNRLQLTLYGHLVVEVRAAGAETGKKLYLQVSILSPVDYKTNIYSEAIKDSR